MEIHIFFIYVVMLQYIQHEYFVERLGWLLHYLIVYSQLNLYKFAAQGWGIITVCLGTNTVQIELSKMPISWKFMISNRFREKKI